MSEDINETPSASPNFKTELAKQLEELVPEAIADGKVDVAKLKELLDSDAADESERFGLFWPGKLRAIRAAQTPTTATLKPEPELSKDWDATKNVFIEGDNLEALKILQKHYHGEIRMIYIDPPYNTGKDFVYPDNYKEGLQTYLEWTKQVSENGNRLSSNSESDGRYHSHWLNMMYPRLKLARSLLTTDGILYISIDDHELNNLRLLGDEIFGTTNCLGVISVVNNLKGRSDDGYFATSNEFLLCYARSAPNAHISGFDLPADMQKEYKLSDQISKYKEVGLQKTGKNSRRIDRPNMYYPIYFNPTTEGFSLSGETESLEILPTPINGVDGRWRWGRETFLKNKDTELTARKVGNNWRVYVKMRDIVDGRPRTVKPKTTWINPKYDTGNGGRAVKDLFEGSNPFDNPKSPQFLFDILKTATIADSVVLDFFSGSSTTAHAVMSLNAEDGGNRRHIQVQLPEPVDPSSAAGQAGFKTIADIARKRIDLAGEKIKQDYAEQVAKRDTPLDVGYRTYKLTDTNFTKWRETSDTDATTLEQHLFDLRENADDDADQLALLTEILLKQGYSLTEKVEPIEVEGLDVLSVAGGLALAYVNEQVKPTLGQLRAVVDREPERLIILEDAFQGDDQLKTNLVQLAKTKRVNLWTA